MFSIETLSSKQVRRFREIRLASLKDSPEAFKSTYSEMTLLPDQVWEQQLGNLPTFVAVDNGVDIGVVRCAVDWDEPTAAHLYSLWVVRRHRGLGVGKALIKAVLEWAKTKGLAQVRLNVVKNNRTALSLYKELGFKFTGRTEQIDGRKGLQELQMAVLL